MASSDPACGRLLLELRCGQGIAAERLACEQEIHVLQVAVEARRHAHAVEDAEPVTEGGASGLMSEVASALLPFLPIQGSGSLPR
jgi:hypothetical protein